CGVQETAWKYVSLLEIRRIAAALATAAVLLFIFAWIADSLRSSIPSIHAAVPPRGVVVLDLLVGLVGLIAMRVFVRARHERLQRKGRRSTDIVKKNTLLIGAGCVGADVVRQVAENPHLGIEPVGFLDDNPKKKGMLIHGARVLGTVADLGEIAKSESVEQ